MLPSEMQGVVLYQQLAEEHAVLIVHVAEIDLSEVAVVVGRAAMAELEYATRARGVCSTASTWAGARRPMARAVSTLADVGAAPDRMPAYGARREATNRSHVS
ncbi:hypothetical protein GCM10015535_31310 [Streptomyces gelaticus]|uniref:Uncharacterized protein n=1 Tax=Streptomyces gelaticus TaxID=285446 RepID=A0ABQ2VYF6_9ACTN|nr:hypothetical protein GCM10015535_31310 [Streptomyces gelaticus]